MPSRRSLLAQILAAPLLAASARAGGSAAEPPLPPTPVMGQMHQVDIQGFAFQPATLTVAPGDTVVFTNRDAAPHTVTADSGAFDSGRLATGQTIGMSFNARGDYSYYCALHPRMRGSITVA
ncbi:cupredoxin domain-containing protein [Limimaricola variabilis]